MSKQPHINPQQCSLRLYYLVWSCLLVFGRHKKGKCGVCAACWFMFFEYKGSPLSVISHQPTVIHPALPINSPPLVQSFPSPMKHYPPDLRLAPSSPAAAHSSLTTQRTLLIYEPFHTALLPLETQVWLVLHCTPISPQHQHTSRRQENKGCGWGEVWCNMCLSCHKGPY